jgi:tripartite-type tricarboxylate transporter receptor subunit TctC
MHGLRLLIRAFCLALLLGTDVAGATEYPEKPIHLIVPFAAGGPTDAMARIVAQKLKERLAQPIVVENRVGASGTVGMLYVARSAPDGYTLLWANTNLATNPSMFKSATYDPVKDFAPIAMVGRMPFMLVVHPSFPAKTVKEFVDYINARPGQLDYASAGNGTMAQIAMELIKSTGGLKINHIPFQGSAPAITAVLGGHVPIYVDTVSALKDHAKAERMRPLAVLSAKRLAVMPNLPTLAENGFPGFDVIAFAGVLAPAGTEPSVVSRLNAEIKVVMNMPEVRERIAGLGIEPLASSPAEFRQFLQGEVPRVAKILKESGATID